MTTTQQPKSGGLEVRSIDYVPLNERHGKLWHLGPLWFMSNAQIATLAVGLISISAGASLFWSVVSIVLGTLLGTLFMAFHSAQGPQLGLPQMIQSRPQFGYIGALLVWFFAYVQYAGFNVFNSVLAGESVNNTAHGGTKTWVVITTIVAFVIALIGYDLIHKAEQFLTYAMLLIFGIFTIALFFIHYPAEPSISGRSRPRRSWVSSAWSPATRSVGPSTSPTIRATCRRTSPCARRSCGPIGVRPSAAAG